MTNPSTIYAVVLAMVFGMELSALTHQERPAPLPKDIPSLKALAEKGGAEAQFMLGAAYYFGEGVDVDFKLAVDWYKKSAEQGNSKAQFNLGSAYWYGKGVPKDQVQTYMWWTLAAGNSYALAKEWMPKIASHLTAVQISEAKKLAEVRSKHNKPKPFLKDTPLLSLKALAEKEDAGAQYNLGLKYYKGEVVNLDHAEAVRWFRKAAEQGEAEAQSNLGFMYHTGQGVKKDYKEAIKWWRRAAEQNFPKAQYNLGHMYEKGLGAEKDYKEAVKWFRKAAEQNFPQAQINLGYTYTTGRGVKKGYKEAFKWWRKAAEQDYARAQCDIGNMYWTGAGVEKDVVTGYAWHIIAAANGHADAKKYKANFAEQMTPDQIIKAKALAREMQKKIEVNQEAKKKE